MKIASLPKLVIALTFLVCIGVARSGDTDGSSPLAHEMSKDEDILSPQNADKERGLLKLSRCHFKCRRRPCFNLCSSVGGPPRLKAMCMRSHCLRGQELPCTRICKPFPPPQKISCLKRCKKANLGILAILRRCRKPCTRKVIVPPKKRPTRKPTRRPTPIRIAEPPHILHPIDPPVVGPPVLPPIDPPVVGPPSIVGIPLTTLGKDEAGPGANTDNPTEEEEEEP